MARPAIIRLGVVLCGETNWDREGRVLGAADLPLSNSGRAAVESGLGGLVGRSIAGIWHPEDEAATGTARVIAGATGARAKAVEELADPGLGLLEGMLWNDFQERHPKRHKQLTQDPLSLVPPEGEPFGEARERQFRAIARILRKGRSGEVVLVMHALGAAMLRCWLADRPSSAISTVLRRRIRVEHYLLAPAHVDALKAIGEGAGAEGVAADGGVS